MKRQNKTNQNKEKKKEQKTKKLVQALVKGRTITVHIEMEKRTGKVALETGLKMAISPFEKAFILFSYLMATDLQDIWLVRVPSNISEKLFSFL